jgi:hypothetical protein
MAYLGFAASAAVGVNPDVLSHDGALLVEAHVLHKLQCKVSICSRSDEESEEVARTFSVLETLVLDSA